MIRHAGPRTARPRPAAGALAEVHDLHAVLLGEPLRDERAVARLRVALDAEERRRPVGRQLFDQRAEVGAVEHLVQVPLAVLRRELGARALAATEPLVLAVLHVPELG